MPTGKQQDISIDGTDAFNYTVRPHADLLRRFASRTAVAEEIPVRPLAKNFGGGQTFILAVVPFHEVRIGFRAGSEAGELASSSRTLQWAGKHLGKFHASHAFSQPLRVALAIRGQWQVGKASVLPGESPGRVAVPCHVDLRKCLTHASVSPDEWREPTREDVVPIGFLDWIALWPSGMRRFQETPRPQENFTPLKRNSSIGFPPVWSLAGAPA